MAGLRCVRLVKEDRAMIVAEKWTSLFGAENSCMDYIIGEKLVIEALFFMLHSMNLKSIL